MRAPMRTTTRSAKSVVLMYTMTVVAYFLILLPCQKAETQELIRNGGSSKVIGGITIFYLAFALVWSVMVNFMASISCFVIATCSDC